MHAFETSATVGEQGWVRLAGVPFAPGTEVDVTISPRVIVADAPDRPTLAERRARMEELFRTVRGFHGTPRISREELYDRPGLR